MTEGLFIAMLIFALGVAFLLSGIEAGVLALSRFRIRRLARQGDRRAALLQQFLDHPESFLWTILVGNTLAAGLVVAIGTLALGRWLESSLTFAVAIVVMLLVLFVFADLLPKLLFRRFPNRLCLLAVGPFRLLRASLAPIVGTTEWVSRRLLRLTGGQAFTGRLFGSRAELRQVIEESSASLSREELVMINRILDLQNLRVRDVMTPIERAVSLEASQSVSHLLDIVRERRVSYVPLWKDIGRGRRVLGVVSVGGLLFDGEPELARSLETLVQPAVFVEETTRLEDVVRQLQRGRQRLAVVLDSRRREVGVITMNDVLRTMFGEVRV
jgi:putative hemolysin